MSVERDTAQLEEAAFELIKAAVENITYSAVIEYTDDDGEYLTDDEIFIVSELIENATIAANFA